MFVLAVVCIIMNLLTYHAHNPSTAMTSDNLNHCLLQKSVTAMICGEILFYLIRICNYTNRL